MNPDTNIVAAPAASANPAVVSTAANPTPSASTQPAPKPQKSFGKKAKFSAQAPKL